MRFRYGSDNIGAGTKFTINSHSYLIIKVNPNILGLVDLESMTYILRNTACKSCDWISEEEFFNLIGFITYNSIKDVKFEKAKI